MMRTRAVVMFHTAPEFVSDAAIRELDRHLESRRHHAATSDNAPITALKCIGDDVAVYICPTSRRGYL